jgi:type VI secretion system secreted protein Hcp
MSRRVFTVLIVVAGLVSGIVSFAEAQKTMNAFLRIEGIVGESTDAKHRGEIDIESFGWSESQVGAGGSAGGGGRATGRTNMGGFQFSAFTSQASPKLFQMCAAGQFIKSVILTVRNRAGLETMTWRLSDVTVRDYKIVGDTNRDARTRDEFSLDFQKIEFEYRPVLPNGTLGPAVKERWDVQANRPF